MIPGHVESWYAASANDATVRPFLTESISCDVCVIGGGYTGLSAALHLSQAGYDVTLLEAYRVAWGASGRNGGHVGSGQRKDEADLEHLLGLDTARRLFQFGEDAKTLVRSLINEHGIDCDLTDGQLVVAVKKCHADVLSAGVEKLVADYGYHETSYLDADAVGKILNSKPYYGGAIDRGAASLHPLNYALGLARAAEAAGARIFEASRVLAYDNRSPTRIRTADGEVTAKYLVLACNGYLVRLEPRLDGYIMPINNFLIATAPLGEEQSRTLIRDRVCVHDTKFVVNYFRVSDDHRLIFGGGETYTRRYPHDIKAFVSNYMLDVFPQLEDLKIDYGWGGTLAITINRLPSMGRLEPNVFYSQGYSGHGVPTATFAGKLLAEAVAGTAERFDVFANIPTPRFPGGTLLRWPGLVLGMLYYAMRDRLP